MFSENYSYLIFRKSLSKNFIVFLKVFPENTLLKNATTKYYFLILTKSFRHYVCCLEFSGAQIERIPMWYGKLTTLMIFFLLTIKQRFFFFFFYLVCDYFFPLFQVCMQKSMQIMLVSSADHLFSNGSFVGF